jgi:hypothetical protein
MNNFSTNPNINLDASYCDVEYVSDEDVNRLKVEIPLKDEHGSPSIPVLNKGRWKGGSGFYYICPCSFWQYNKDKAILDYAVQNGIVDSSYNIPEDSNSRKKLLGLFNEVQHDSLKKILNKIKSPCGVKCSVCHDTHGGVYGDLNDIKDYAVLAATHGSTASNYDSEYASKKRNGDDTAVYRSDNKHGLETKYKEKYMSNIPLNPELFNRTNESINNINKVKKLFLENYDRFFYKK